MHFQKLKLKLIKLLAKLTVRVLNYKMQLVNKLKKQLKQQQLFRCKSKTYKMKPNKLLAIQLNKFMTVIIKLSNNQIKMLKKLLKLINKFRI